MNQKTPYGYSIFCDDIRTEMNGKSSLMGLYPDSIVFDTAFPVSMERLFISTTVMFKLTDEPKDIKIIVFMPGDEPNNPTAEFEMSEDDLASAMDATVVHPLVEDAMLKMNINMKFVPINFASEGLIRVRGFYGSEELKIGALVVTTRATP